MWHFQHQSSGQIQHPVLGVLAFRAGVAAQTNIFEVGSASKSVQLLFALDVGQDMMVEVLAATSITTSVTIYSDTQVGWLARRDLARTSVAELGHSAEDPNTGDLSSRIHLQSGAAAQAFWQSQIPIVAAPGEVIRCFSDNQNQQLLANFAWVEF